jgi:hypothetical protein
MVAIKFTHLWIDKLGWKEITSVIKEGEFISDVKIIAENKEWKYFICMIEISANTVKIARAIPKNITEYNEIAKTIN